MTGFEIIDFHTHPFADRAHNICVHPDYCGDMSPENIPAVFRNLGVSRICGSVIRWSGENEPASWGKIRENNDMALELKRRYGDFYVPGFHVHPGYPEESFSEIRRMHEAGIRLVGELVPYMDRWGTLTYASDQFSELLSEIGRLGMVVSVHAHADYMDDLYKMVRRHPDVVFVAAHPGEYKAFMRHLEIARLSGNYCLDLSGTGIFRYGVMRRAIDCMGADRVLYGSDYPVCDPAVFLGGVLLNGHITDAERELVLAGNAKRLLGL